MSLIGPSLICSGLLPSSQLLKLTITLANLAFVTAEDKIAMPSPRAAREILSHFKCQNLLFETSERFNIDKKHKWTEFYLNMKKCRYQKLNGFNLTVYGTNCNRNEVTASSSNLTLLLPYQYNLLLTLNVVYC